MSPRYKTATKTAVSTQTKVLVAVVAVASLGLAAVGYGFGFGSVKPSKLTTARPVAKSVAKPIEKPPAINTIGGVQQISPSDRPVYKKITLSSTVLTNNDQDLYKFLIAPELSKSVRWKQLVFSFETTPTLSVSLMRLQKGSTDLKLNDYDIECPSCGGDVKNGTITAASGLLVVTLKGEEIAAGSGNVYTLHGMISGVVKGSSLKISLYRNPNQTINNGYLTNNAIAPFMSSNPNIVNIDLANPPIPTGQADLPGIFVWSASSTGSHSPSIGLNGGSSDWFSDIQIDSTQLTEELSL